MREQEREGKTMASVTLVTAYICLLEGKEGTKLCFNFSVLQILRRNYGFQKKKERKKTMEWPKEWIMNKFGQPPNL